MGYFILPADAIFDLTPIIGYSDDLGVLLFTLTQISGVITNEVKEKARNKINEWFSEINEKEIIGKRKHIKQFSSQLLNYVFHMLAIMVDGGRVGRS